MSVSSKQTFEARFRRFSAVRRGILNATLGYGLGTVALAAGCAALLLLTGWLTNLYVNAALFAIFALGVLALGITYLIKHRRFRSCLEEAFIMEELDGRLNSRLVSAWDFHEQGLEAPLAQVVIERAATDLQLPFEDRLDRTSRNRRRNRCLTALVIFVALGCLPWFSFARLYSNAARTWLALGDTLFPVAYTLEPAPGRHIHKLGDRVEIKFRLARKVYDSVTFVVAQGERLERHEVRLGTDNQGGYSLTSGTEAEYTVRVEFGRRRTGDVNLVFATVPVLVNMQTELIYPVYTRMLPRTLEGVQGRIMALAGTRLTLGFTFTKTIDSATITWDDGEKLPLDVVGRFASSTIMHMRQRRASLQVTDKFGFGLEFPTVIDFDLQLDEKPRLYLPKHLKDDMPMLAKELAEFGFGARAEDDFGITKCVLKWQKSTVENPGQILDRGEIERLVSPPQRKAVIAYEKAFAGMNIQPGDKLTFTVDAYDNCMPDKQVTHSRPASLFIFREALDGLTIKELGFGSGDVAQQGRIAKSQRATSVREPEVQQLREKVRNEFEAAVSSSTRAPTVRGEFGAAARDYFRLLSGVSLKDEKTEKPGPASNARE